MDVARESDDPQILAWIEQSRNGDSRAFGNIVTAYQSRIYAMILQMIRNEADAWDLSQEVFVRAWRSLAQFEGRSSFATWLFRITHNIVCDFARSPRNAPKAAWEDSMEGLIAPDATVSAHAPRPDQAAEHSELGDQIAHAINQLSPEHQTVILLKEVQGLSYKEIAEATNSSMGTVMSRLFYARKQLQTMLSHAR